MKTLANRLTALLLCVVMLSMCTLASVAADDNGRVYVIVENTTYTDTSAAWSGTLVEEWIGLEQDSTMMSCVVAALNKHGYTQRGAESNYISEINGLAAFDGGNMSGWMGTLNDWFTNEGFGAFTVAGGTLTAGDEIRIMYTLSYGEDLGGSWGNNDKTVKNVTFSEGQLTSAFSKDVHEYTLTVPAGVNALTVTPTASNKNYQVRTSVDGVEYKRTSYVPVSNGTVITVKCGDPAWPSMNGDGEAQVYTFTVNEEKNQADIEAAEKVVSKIDGIGSVTLSSESSIRAAREAYDALTDEQKALVVNYPALVEAEKAYADMVKSAGAKLDDVYRSVGDYLASLGAPNVGSVGGEWMVIGLARSGREVAAEYYNNVLKYVAENINDKEQLHRSKSTDNSRVILALTALGYDVTNVGGHDLLVGLSDLSYIKKQGINGPIWALIAFDSHGYEIPEGDVTRDALLGEILAAQLENGGWALSGSNADPDMTAMALQALAPYYKTNSDVASAVDRALNCLSEMQTASGGYVSWGSVNSESCAQVIAALTALGIDPLKDERFIKNGCTVIDALASFYTEDGGFCHVAGGKLNGMATEQGYYALAAYARLRDGKTSLYDMSDVTIGSGDTFDDESSYSPVPPTGDNSVSAYVLIILAALACAAAVSKKRKYNV